MERVIRLEITADTEGKKTKTYYAIDGESKTEVDYKSLTSEEKRALLKTMGLLGD